jgi:hypothetical protein
MEESAEVETGGGFAISVGMLVLLYLWSLNAGKRDDEAAKNRRRPSSSHVTRPTSNYG